MDANIPHTDAVQTTSQQLEATITRDAVANTQNMVVVQIATRLQPDLSTKVACAIPSSSAVVLTESLSPKGLISKVGRSC